MISYMRLEWYLVVLQQQCRPSDEASEVGVRFSPWILLISLQSLHPEVWPANVVTLRVAIPHIHIHLFPISLGTCEEIKSTTIVRMRDDMTVMATPCKARSHGLMRVWFHHTTTMQFSDKWSWYVVILSWLGVIVESIFVYLVFFHTYDLYYLWCHVFCKASMPTELEFVIDSPSDNLLLWCDSIVPKKSKLYGRLFSSRASVYPTRKVMTNNMCNDVQMYFLVKDVRW